MTDVISSNLILASGDTTARLAFTPNPADSTPTQAYGWWDTTLQMFFIYDFGTAAWVATGGAGGTPGGSNTQLQYNNSSAFGGISGITTDGTRLIAAAGDIRMKGSSTGYTDFTTANAGVSNYTVTFQAVSYTVASAGANSDITSLSGLTTALSVAQGGTGAATFTADGMLYGNTTSAIQVTAAGTQGQVFAAGASGVPAPIGGKTLFSSTTTSGSQGSVTVSSIPAGKVLEIEISGRCSATANFEAIQIQFNSDTGSHYIGQELDANGVTVQTEYLTAAASAAIGYLTAASGTANYSGMITVKLARYADTTFYKQGLSSSNFPYNAVSGSIWYAADTITWLSTSAITAIKVFPTTGNFVDGTGVDVYITT